MQATTTFTWRNAVFEISRPTVRTAIRIEYIANLVSPGLRKDYEWKEDVEYANFIGSVKLKSGDPGFVIPSIDDPVGIRAFYEPFMNETHDLRSTFINARNELVAANDPDLTPGVEKKEQGTPTTEEKGLDSSEKQTDHSSE